jgi:hypothetical protein
METETNSEKLKILIKAKINPFIIISGFEKNNRNKKIRMTLNFSWRDDKKSCDGKIYLLRHQENCRVGF